jgi:NTP pyrophosphatase (non-canonical NTP hydrolase)
VSTLDLEELQVRLREFAAARDWARFHTPKNLAMALSAEAGELVELYQWLTPEESVSATHDGEFREALTDELADVLIYLVQLADAAGINLTYAVSQKLGKNEQKHPPAVSS